MASEVEMRWDGADRLIAALNDYGKAAEAELERAMTEIAVAWEGEAKRRVPVESGLLRNTLLHETGKDGDGHYVAVGSNQDYAPHIEFGTEWIAGGAVKALGLDPNITDAQAIKSWPAKDANSTAGSTEQMPFLRPAFMALKNWIIQRLSKVLRMR